MKKISFTAKIVLEYKESSKHYDGVISGRNITKLANTGKLEIAEMVINEFDTEFKPVIVIKEGEGDIQIRKHEKAN